MIFPGQRNQNGAFEDKADYAANYYSSFDSENFKIHIHINLKKIVQGIGNVIKAAGNELKKVGKAAEWALVLPFKGMMKNHLERQGVSHSGSLDDIATKFYHTEVKPSGFVDAYDTLKVSNDTRENQISDVASLVVNGILDYIKNLKNKKAKGEKLTPGEQKMLDDANASAEALKKQVGEFAGAGISGMIQRHLMLIIGLAIGTVVLIIFFVGVGTHKHAA